MAREPNRDERGILDALLTIDFPGRDALRAQAAAVAVTGAACGCGCPSVSLAVHRSLRPAPVGDRVPVSGHGPDANGVHVGVLLRVVDGYLHELEAYDVEGSDADRYDWPDLASFRVGVDMA
jgi:hypothetical protein